MNPPHFAKYLTEFLTIYLPGHKNVSKNTIYSYRDTFILLLKYYQKVKDIVAERINFDVLTRKVILEFLDWLEIERKCSISTRNQRLAAIRSFFRYVQYEYPDEIYHFQQVISIPVKKTERKVLKHLSPEVMEYILQQPDKYSAKGRRDFTLLSVLYDTGARVQELIDIKVGDVILDSQPIIVLNGKGNKIRRVPLMKNTAKLLHTYFSENDLQKTWKRQYPLFRNNQHNKLTKEGIAYILNKYVKMAKRVYPAVPDKVSVHVLRHSKATHLLQAGINIIYIRDFLGHADVKTTERYAKNDSEIKRKAIENAYPDIIDCKMPNWEKDKKLLSWLSSLK